tara:strand:+ start:111 stop:233 length:123 start_codon:yes stop_codon:yes gene_type:complete
MIGKLFKCIVCLPLLPVIVLFAVSTTDLDYEGEHSGGGGE